MNQEQLPDLGVTIWRKAKCPMCGGTVTWTVVEPYAKKITCDNTPGEGKRGKRPQCGFTMRRAEWDYLREKPNMAPKLRAQFGKEKESKERPMDPIVAKMLETDRENDSE